MQHYAEMRIRDTELIPLAVWSPEDPDPPPMIGGWAYIEMPNQPLGKKWNAGVKALMSLDVDALVIIGSDDFLSSTYFDLVQEQLKRGAGLISVRDAFVYIPPGDTVAYIESVSSGAGRVVTRRTIELLKGRLWDDDATIGVDPISNFTELARSVETFDVLDFPTSFLESIWQFNFTGAGTENLVGTYLIGFEVRGMNT